MIVATAYVRERMRAQHGDYCQQSMQHSFLVKMGSVAPVFFVLQNASGLPWGLLVAALFVLVWAQVELEKLRQETVSESLCSVRISLQAFVVQYFSVLQAIHGCSVASCSFPSLHLLNKCLFYLIFSYCCNFMNQVSLSVLSPGLMQLTYSLAQNLCATFIIASMLRLVLFLSSVSVYILSVPLVNFVFVVLRLPPVFEHFFNLCHVAGLSVTNLASVNTAPPIQFAPPFLTLSCSCILQ